MVRSLRGFRRIQMIVTKTARICLFVVLVATTVGCDRVTKHMARTSLAGTPVQSFFADTFRLEYAENTGGFLSIGADFKPAVRTAIFRIGTAVILLGALIAAIKLRLAGWQRVGITLAFAGGASNLLDRIRDGAVIDFLNVGFGSLRTGIFNVADVAILLGICIWMIPLGRNKVAQI
jgi:signal peptidase II